MIDQLFLWLSLISMAKTVQLIAFELNPGCSLNECHLEDKPALFYTHQYVSDGSIHIFFSSFDLLTISIIETRRGFLPTVNYSALFNRNYSGAIYFEDTEPMNSISLTLRRLIRFNDENDSGMFDENSTIIESYWLNRCETNRTDGSVNITQPSFLFPLNDIHGQLIIQVQYPGESSRDSALPRLSSTEKSFFLNIILQADQYSSKNTRFAFEFYFFQMGMEGTEIVSSRYLDDQYTPGIFTVWLMRSISPLYYSSMLWKPVVYQSSARSVEASTLMQVYSLKNHPILDASIDQGLFDSFFQRLDISALNISLGRSKDGFFSETNYSFIQFTAGLEFLETDSIGMFVIFASIATVSLPSLILIIGLICIVRRRCQDEYSSAYRTIDD